MRACSTSRTSPSRTCSPDRWPRPLEPSSAVEDAPAVVTVVTREEIRRGGYRTVAAALEMIPGFAVNTDHVLFNAGLRGISGGIRGGSRHLKVLVDGVPVSFLPDAWNFLGPEFLPISAVERIEVVTRPGLCALWFERVPRCG